MRHLISSFLLFSLLSLFGQNDNIANNDTANLVVELSATFEGQHVSILENGIDDTVASSMVTESTALFNDLSLGEYLVVAEGKSELGIVTTYYGNAFEWQNADTLSFQSDDTISIEMIELPPESPGGESDFRVVVEEDFEERRPAKFRDVWLKRRRTGGRTEQDDAFELFLLGMTDENGEFNISSLPQGIYRFGVEITEIANDPSVEIEFEIGEAGITNECPSLFLKVLITLEGIQSEVSGPCLGLDENDLTLYPNPAHEKIKIKLNSQQGDGLGILIHDLQGQVVKHVQYTEKGEISIDLDRLDTGLYLIRLMKGDKSIYETKFFKR